MDRVQLVICRCAFIALFACYQIRSIQARQFMQLNEEERFNNNIEAHDSTPTTANHLSAEKKIRSENVSSPIPSSGNLTNAVRPTTSGDSPGAGHSFPNENELVEQLNSPNSDRHFHAGNKDDFSPASPGHSLGVGKNAEPNA